MAHRKMSSGNSEPTKKSPAARTGKSSFQSQQAMDASLKAAQVVSRRIGGMQRGVQQRQQKRKDSR